VDEAQTERILVTRRGKPAALIIGVEGHGLEDLQWEVNPRFWELIEERRHQPTIDRAELERRLKEREGE
jgi:antitoxin (DNA-binding transcriptional repressor) of toxin-antitoxin stability system